jgi:hypothetical protein
VLILVSSTHILCNVPAIVNVVLLCLMDSDLISVNWRDQLVTFNNYAGLLYIAGYAINFFLYTISGRVYRDQLLAIVCGRRQCCRKAVGGGEAGVVEVGTQKSARQNIID